MTMKNIRGLFLFALFIIFIEFCVGCVHRPTYEELVLEAGQTGDWVAVNEYLDKEIAREERRRELEGPEVDCGEDAYPVYERFGSRRSFVGCQSVRIPLFQ